MPYALARQRKVGYYMIKQSFLVSVFPFYHYLCWMQDAKSRKNVHTLEQVIKSRVLLG